MISFGTSHSGAAPSPFDARNGSALAGPEGSHPLHHLTAAELLQPASGPVDGSIELAAPGVVGGALRGRIRLVAREAISARGASLRLVGLKLVEHRESRTEHDSEGRPSRTEEWVEARGELFVADRFPEPAIPAKLAAGETFEADFAVPAPPLGPPSAHLGEAIVAYALEVRWDVAFGADAFVAVLVPVAQHPDLIRAGVGAQGGESLLETVSDGEGTIGVRSELPARGGEALALEIRWPDAPGGGGARVELHRRTNCPNGVEGILASAPLDPAALAGGASVTLPVPAGAPPSFDGAGLEIRYVIRVLVDRRFRPDAAIERPVAIV